MSEGTSDVATKHISMVASNKVKRDMVGLERHNKPHKYPNTSKCWAAHGLAYPKYTHIHTHIHTYIHTYTHTYMHTLMQPATHK